MKGKWGYGIEKIGRAIEKRRVNEELDDGNGLYWYIRRHQEQVAEAEQAVIDAAMEWRECFSDAELVVARRKLASACDSLRRLLEEDELPE